MDNNRRGFGNVFKRFCAFGHFRYFNAGYMGDVGGVLFVRIFCGDGCLCVNRSDVRDGAAFQPSEQLCNLDYNAAVFFYGTHRAKPRFNACQCFVVYTDNVIESYAVQGYNGGCSGMANSYKFRNTFNFDIFADKTLRKDFPQRNNAAGQRVRF